MGAVVPEALAAAEELTAAGRSVDVLCLTSADLVFRALQARQGLADGDDGDPRRLFPRRRGGAARHRARRAPAHALVPRGGRGGPIASLGVQDFGQSGDVEDLYRHFGIDADTIVGAALDLIG